MSTGAIDPFEEFLRKKKVEKLEEKYRQERAGEAEPQDDEIAVFAEVYDAGTRPPHSVEVATTIRSAGGDIVFEETEDHESTELQGARGTLRHTTQIPLETLEPGEYVLTVEVSSSLDGDVKVVRQVPFRVTPVKQARQA